MKKLLTILLSVGMLTGCTSLIPSPHGDVPVSDTVLLDTQFPVYAPDIDRIQVILENNGETNLEYGVEWTMEVLKGEEWKQLPFAEGYAWIQPLYTLMPGGTDSFYVSTDMLDYDLKEGTYRVVKEISGEIYTAEFLIGESSVSADSPYGYVPLEELPADYSTEDAVSDGVVVYHCTDGSFENADKIPVFLDAVIHGIDSQLRFAYYSSNTPDKILLSEVTYTQSAGNTPRFHIRHDYTRQQPDTEIGSSYFTNLTTRNDKLFCFANVPDTYKLSADSHRTLYPLNKDWNGKEEWLERIREYAATLYPTVSAWSPDGLRHVRASMDDVLHFYVNIRNKDGGELGYTADLLSIKSAVSIKEFVWQDETTVMIVCRTQQENTQYYGGEEVFCYVFYDTDEEKVTDTVFSPEYYRFDENGSIIIPE